jgi:hypothetical protein
MSDRTIKIINSRTAEDLYWLLHAWAERKEDLTPHEKIAVERRNASFRNGKG